MKKWAWVVILLYATILSGIIAGLACLTVEDVLSETISVIIVLWVALMAVCQASLLVVPVRVHSRRPVTRRHLFWPVTVAVLSCVLMAVCMFLAIWETIAHSAVQETEENEILIYAGLGVGVLWIIWAFIFGSYTGGRKPTTLMIRTTRFLLAGSILELLVAVPTHVIVRSQNYCCVGWMTVWGLGLGASVMLFAFGPVAPDHTELQRDTEPAGEPRPEE